MSAIERVIEISKSGYELVQEEDWYELLDEIKELDLPELAELRKDRERLEWRKAHPCWDVRYNNCLTKNKWVIVERDENYIPTGQSWYGSTWEEVIDKAMEA